MQSKGIAYRARIEILSPGMQAQYCDCTFRVYYHLQDPQPSEGQPLDPIHRGVLTQTADMRYL